MNNFRWKIYHLTRWASTRHVGMAVIRLTEDGHPQKKWGWLNKQSSIIMGIHKSKLHAVGNTSLVIKRKQERVKKLSFGLCSGGKASVGGKRESHAHHLALAPPTGLCIITCRLSLKKFVCSCFICDTVTSSSHDDAASQTIIIVAQF